MRLDESIIKIDRLRRDFQQNCLVTIWRWHALYSGCNDHVPKPQARCAGRSQLRCRTVAFRQQAPNQVVRKHHVGECPFLTIRRLYRAGLASRQAPLAKAGSEG